jgi:thiol-disulfide isomerase/thioredoxin
VTVRRAAAAGAVVVALLLSACGGTASDGSSAPAATGRAAGQQDGPAASGAPEPCPALDPAEPVEGGLPDLELPCLGDGPAVNLADLRGLPTVVNVWAAWCTNCEREMPLLADAQDKAGDRVRFFGVHYKAPRAYGLRSEADFGVPFPSVHDEDGDRVVQQMGAYAPPQTFFVDADGRVAGRKIGEITSEEQLASLVQQYLGVSL